MDSAVPEFTAALDAVELAPAQATVVSAVTAEPFDDVRAELVAALTRPVRWRETMLALQALGAERFIEVGPGRVLTGLAKRTVQGVELVRV
jgi:malonyl CoA-acyl carrier protein transacylase